mgnify:FL=1
MNHLLEARPLLPTFFGAALFERLSPETCQRIPSKLVLSRFRPGQIIQAEGVFPFSVYCVVQGQVRIVGPSSQGSQTIALLGESETFGWESFVRGVCVGSARAAGNGETLTLSLPAEEFVQLMHDELSSTLEQQVSAIEIYDLIVRFCSNSPTRLDLPDLTEVARYVAIHNRVLVKTWTGQSHEEFSSDYLWFISSDTNRPIGTLIQSIEDLPRLNRKSRPIRIVGIDRKLLAFALSTGLLPADDADRIPVQTEALVALDRLESLTRRPATKAVAPLKPLTKIYPAHLGRTTTTAEAIVVAFWNACEYLDVPYKPEYLRSWSKLAEIELDQSQFFAQIAGAFGLGSQTVRFPATPEGLSRLQLPALVIVDQTLCVLYESAETAVFASPTDGLKQCTLAQFVERLNVKEVRSEAPLGEAIVLVRQSDSPSNQFGWWWLVGFFKPHTSTLMYVLLASIVVQLLGLANPLLTQQIVDKVIINGSPGALPLFGTLLMSMTVLEQALTIVRSFMLNDTTNRVDLQLGVQIVRHLFNLPLPFFQKRPVGELAARINELETVRRFLTGTFFTVVLDVLFSAIYIGVMVLYSPALTLCVLISVPLVVGLTLVAAPILQKLLRRRADLHAQMQSHLIEMLGGMFTIKTQHMEPMILATWQQQYQSYLKVGLKTTMAGTVFQSINTGVSNFSSLLVLWVGSSQVLDGSLTLGQLIAFRIIAGYVVQPLVRLSQLWQNAQEANLSIDLLADVKNVPTEYSEVDRQRLSLPPITGRVQYDAVNFGFQAGQLQLVNVSIDIAPGTFVGLVGQSGSGKSTMVKLLPRLYEPMNGSIYIDGIDIGKVNLSSLREQVGFVPQEPVIFKGTIRDNIAKDLDVDDAAVIEAAKIAEVHDFIMTLPDGYATQLGESGSSLSGGQRQRLAIARMVCRNPRLVILDEATSALDAETERKVVDNLMRRFSDQTCFFITHRLSNLCRSDVILYLKSGALVEQGTHLDLMARRQQYYCLYQQQAHAA